MEQDYAKALEWFEKAIEAGETTSIEWAEKAIQKLK